MSEIITKEVTSKKAYQLRPLCAKDIFPMSKIISKIGISEFSKSLDSDDIKSMVKSKKADIETIGLKVIMSLTDVVLQNLSTCEKDIYTLLASLSSKKVKDIEELPISVFAEMVIDVVSRAEFKDFIKVVSKSFNSIN